MPKDILLQDFKTGAYDLTVRQNGRTGRKSRGAVSTGPAAVTITTRRTTGRAPAGFMFLATATGFAADHPFQQLRYKWTFGDPGSVHDRLAANMPWGQDANVAYGPVAAHTYFPKAADFLAAGSDTITYTATVEVTDGIVTVTETVDVTVENPDVYFAGASTVIIDPSGDFTLGLSLYPGAQTATTLDAGHNLVANNAPKRLLLRKGQTYSHNRSGFDALQLQIGNFGNAGEAKPIITPILGRDAVRVSSNMGNDCEIWGLDLQGPYDPTVPTSRNGISNGIDIQGGNKDDRFTTIHDVQSTGFKFCFTFEGNRNNNVVSNCIARDWYDFGAYGGEIGWTAFVGTTLQQNPLAVNGGGKYSSDFPNHGPNRFSRIPNGYPVLYNNCDLASFNDWGGSESTYNVQPTIRLNNGGAQGLPKLCVTQVRATGAQLGFPATNSYTASFPVEGVVDKIYHIKWGQGGRHLGASFGGVRFSNIVTIEPDTDWAKGDLFAAGPGGYSPDGDYPTRYPVYLGYPDTGGEIKHIQEFLGITVVKLGSGANVNVANDPIVEMNFSNNSLYPDGGPISRNPDSVTTGGILIYAPAWGENAAVKTDDPLTEYAARPLGSNRNTEGLNTAYAVPLSAFASYAPTAPAPVQAGEAVPLDDFWGNMRGSTPTAGAIEF